MNNNENDSGTLKFSNPVSVKEETKTFTIQDQVDAVSIARLGHDFNSDFRLALDAAHETLKSISLDEQQVSELKHELDKTNVQYGYCQALNAELKALCREVLTAREQYQFFLNGYANGSASISEVSNASTLEFEACCKLSDYLKSKAQ